MIPARSSSRTRPPSSTTITRRTRWGLVLAALLVASACRADISVEIDIAPDGGGTVTATVLFDAEVMTYVPDLDQILRLDDVRATGWVIDQARADGGLRVTLVKSFRAAEQLADVLAELDGDDGLFGDTQLVVGRRGAMTDYRLEVVVRLQSEVADLIDAEVADVLDGELFGVPIEELERRSGGGLDEAVSLVVTARVPGGEGRLPASGTVALSAGPTSVLVVEGTVLDEEIQAADDAAAAARTDVAGAERLTIVVWVSVAGVAVLLLVLARLLRHRRSVRSPY